MKFPTTNNFKGYWEVTRSGEEIFLPQWDNAGHLSGEGLPPDSSYAWDLDATDTKLWGLDALRQENTPIDYKYTIAGTKLQNIIDQIATDPQYSTRYYNRLVRLRLPNGVLDLDEPLLIHCSFLVISGDPINGTTLEFRPDIFNRYDADVELTANRDRFGLEAMEDGTLAISGADLPNGNFIQPGRSIIRFQPKDVHPDFMGRFNAAIPAHKDFWYGSINYISEDAIASPGTPSFGHIVDQSTNYAGNEGESTLRLNAPALEIGVGDFVLVQAANTRTQLDLDGVDPSNFRSEPTRSRIHQVTAIAGNILTFRQPLEFDVPRNEEADGDPPIATGSLYGYGSFYRSKVKKLKVVEGSGIENCFVANPMSGSKPKLGGGSYNLQPSDALYNYTNLCPDYAIHGFVFKWAVNCWLKQTSMNFAGSCPVATEYAMNIEVRGCEFTNSWNKGIGGSGCFRLSRAWNCLIEGNSIRQLRNFVIANSSSYNVIRVNELIDCDLRLFGGWERYNLIEDNNIRVSKSHGPSPEDPSPYDIATWYPLYWMPGYEGGQHATVSGPQNYIFNNILKRENSAGVYEDQTPYTESGRIYLMGVIRDGIKFLWGHLQRTLGNNIQRWQTNQLFDFSRSDQAAFGVVADLTYDQSSMYERIKKGNLSASQYTCNCPDFSQSVTAEPTSNNQYEKFTRSWSESNAAIDRAGQPCKHIYAAMIALRDEFGPPTDSPTQERQRAKRKQRSDITRRWSQI